MAVVLGVRGKVYVIGKCWAQWRSKKREHLLFL